MKVKSDVLIPPPKLAVSRIANACVLFDFRVCCREPGQHWPLLRATAAAP